jgi:hypothetical protein
MALRSLSEMMDEGDTAKYRPYINTGTPRDIVNGKYMSGVDGQYILSGGLGIVTATIAEANKFKSTDNNGSLINGLARFPDAELKLYDSEYSVGDKTRTVGMSNLYLDDPEKRAAHLEDLKKRTTVYDPATSQGETLDAWFDYMKEIRDFKIKHAKDMTVETEIIDPDTMKPYQMLIPTFMGIDSWTEAMVRQLMVKNEEHDADTEMKEQRTIHMEEGWQKARLMRQLPGICAKGGIYCALTGHLGKKINMGNTPNKKDMAYMGQDETIKSMGNKFYFLMSTIFKISNTAAVVDSNDRRLTQYPSEGHVAGTELQELSITKIRDKNAPSGYQFSSISSQRFGILPGLSYYRYLTDNKYYGLGSPNKVRSPLLGDMNLGRTKIFDLAMTYKVQRALELTYQLCFIQNNWSLRDQPVDYSISIETFAEKLMTSNAISIDDVLNSRGWWTYKGASGADRPMMTLPDILAIFNGTYIPKYLSVGNIPTPNRKG